MCVLLRHILPDGGWHLDWLIERPDTSTEHRLLSFRTEVDPIEAEGPFEATAMPDHRAAYLEFEGEVSGGRGTVTRIWKLECRLRLATMERVEVEIADSGGNRGWQGIFASEDRWTFTELTGL
ncbi:MAG: hypothetical protein CMJ31_10085 [Phycisphaerae bacterium]|nr:hypothetical protein [Phycisphaerae bacterium]